MREAIERTWRNEIIIYSVGIGGPYGVNQGDLKKLSAETGGRAFFPRPQQVGLCVGTFSGAEKLLSFGVAVEPGASAESVSYALTR